MLVQNFIFEHGIEKLKEPPYNIEIREYDDRIVLNYSQINSPKHDPIVRECRALILSKPECKVLARSFDRFFNYEEDPNSKQFAPHTILEKIDGSLISVYHDRRQWCAATRSMAFAEGLTANGNTFLQVFEKAIGGNVDETFTMLDLAKNNTYVFELVSPETRVVTPYPDYDVYLLAVRCNLDGEEYNLASLDANYSLRRFKQPKRYNVNSIADVVKMAKELPAINEGYVCLNDRGTEHTYWRVKVKNPSYLAISHMRANGVLSQKRIAYLVVHGDEEEYLSYFPEDRKHFASYQTALLKAKGDVESLMQYMSIEDKKEFALKVKDSPVGFIMFGLRKGLTEGQIFANMTDDRCLEFLGKYICGES
jgi:hypothetical protein